MSGFQISMLFGAAAFSLVSMVLVFFVTLLALTWLLKPKPSVPRLFVAFALSWVAISFYLPFKSVGYYMKHSGEMYFVELLFSAIALFAVTKLSPTKKQTANETKV